MISYELSDIIYKYVNNELDIDDFEKWLVPRLPSIFRTPESEDADVVFEIEHGLAEMSNKYWSEEDFRQSLREILVLHNVVLVSIPDESELESKIRVTGSASQNLDLFYSSEDVSMPVEWAVPQ